MANALATSVLGLYQQAKSAKDKILTDEMKTTIASYGTQVSNSEIYQQVKTGVNNKTDQVGKMLLKMSENENRVDLDKYLQSNAASEQKEEERKAHFVINDEDDDGETIPIEKKEEPAPEKPLIEKVEEKPAEAEVVETENQKAFKKGNCIELADLDKLNIDWVTTRKEVKN